MPHKRPREPIAPATIPGEPLDPKILLDDEPELASAGLPEIETPVIRSEDLARKPGPDTRVNNSGVKVEPQSDERRRKADAEFAQQDEKAREAVAEFERTMASLPPD